MPPTQKQNKKKRLIDATLFRVLVIFIFGAFIIWSIITSLIGQTFANLILTVLWGAAFFVIDKWDRNRNKREIGWRELFKFPAFNYWNIFWIVITIGFIQAAGAILEDLLDSTFRPSYYESLPDGFEGFCTQMDDPFSIAQMLIIVLASYFIGGYIAGKLPNYKCPSPYRHAIFASLIFALLSASIMIPTEIHYGMLDEFSQDDIGLFILGIMPMFLFSIIGVKVASRKKSTPTDDKNTLVSLPIDERQTRPEVEERRIHRLTITHPANKQAFVNKKSFKRKRDSRRR